MTANLIKEAEYIIENYGTDTVAANFASKVIEYLQKQTLPERSVKIPMTHIPDSSGM